MMKIASHVRHFVCFLSCCKFVTMHALCCLHALRARTLFKWFLSFDDDLIIDFLQTTKTYIASDISNALNCSHMTIKCHIYTSVLIVIPYRHLQAIAVYLDPIFEFLFACFTWRRPLSPHKFLNNQMWRWFPLSIKQTIFSRHTLLSNINIVWRIELRQIANRQWKKTK